MGKSSFVYGLLKYGPDNAIGIFRKSLYRSIDWPNDHYAINFIGSEQSKRMHIPIISSDNFRCETNEFQNIVECIRNYFPGPLAIIPESGCGMNGALLMHLGLPSDRLIRKI
jgi:hypothetical protein